MKNCITSSKIPTKSSSSETFENTISDIMDPSSLVFSYKISIQDIFDLIAANEEARDVDFLSKEKCKQFLDRIRFDFNKAFEYSFENQIIESIAETVNTVLRELIK